MGGGSAGKIGFETTLSKAEDDLSGIITHYNTLENPTDFEYEGGEPEMKLRFDE